MYNSAPVTYWRLGESSGLTAYDWAGYADGIVGSGVTRGTPGAIIGDSNTASTFNGTASSSVIYPTSQPGALKSPDRRNVHSARTVSTAAQALIAQDRTQTDELRCD
jgi:hypothetical protein